MDITELLKITIEKRSSDLHIIPGYHPSIRVNGVLYPLKTYPVLTDELAKSMLLPLLTDEKKEYLITNKELDLGYNFEDSRFRINMYFIRGMIAGAFRLITTKISPLEALNLPPLLHNFTEMQQGFILVTGPTGEGKTTTIAAIINEINTKFEKHILTIEDPIEYLYPPARSIISQREIGQDTHSWSIALKSALREDPDVVVIGEMRDYETIQAALTVAETGHLVFATLHTNSASQTIDRIVGVFPEEQQQQVKHQLASTIEGVISQRLIPQRNGGRIPAVEILTGIPSVKTVIREGKTHLIDNIIQTSGELGMISIDKSLAKLVLAGKVDKDMALTYSNHPEEFISFLRDKK